MLGLPLAFAVPAVLGALALLPVLWVLLRLTPPRPRVVPLPPLRLIRDLIPKEETPARTPPWLLLLRLAVAAAIILAMAGPIWNPAAPLGGGQGPLLVVMDDGFAAAPDWERRIAYVQQRLSAADGAGRLAAVTAASDGPRSIEVGAPAGTLDRLRARKPVPVEPDRMAMLPALTAFAAAQPGTDILWISDGLERGQGRAFGEVLGTLPGIGSVTVADATAVPLAIGGASNAADSLDVRVLRAARTDAAAGTVQAFDAKGLLVGSAPFGFAADATETVAKVTLPVELRNDIARVAVTDLPSAGATALLDGRAKRRSVAVAGGGEADIAQPLLSPTYYITRALTPFANVFEPRGAAVDPIGALLDNKPSVVVLADVGALPRALHDRLARFVENGGVLLRFSGPHLAAAAPDDLVPVALRQGGRTFGGALSWETPKALAPFDKASPFAGLPVPAEVTVNRQVLAEPDAGLPGRTWAQLTDGTPLVTATRRGKGTLVLVHVTADSAWSNLPLSGLFVDMLRRIVDLSPAGGVSSTPDATAPATARPDTATVSPAADKAAVLAPTRTLDGFGTLEPPPPTAKPILASFEADGTLDHPPGFYGPPDAPLAVNALGPADTLARLDLSGLPVGHEALRAVEPLDLRAALLTLAILGFLADALASLWLGGGLRGRRRGAQAAALLMLGATLAGALPGSLSLTPAHAAEPVATSARDMQSALTTRLGYIVTGDNAVDEASRLGLATLSQALADRTSLTPGEPAALDPARDELAFYPLLYWPIVATAPQPSRETVQRMAAYMRQGGTVVFDTRDALNARPDGPPSPEATWLRTMLSGVDVPALEPVPSDHVITKTFYLLPSIVGRYTTGQTWIEALPPASREEANRPVRSGDSVSPILITGNDLAGAWAASPDGQALYPLVPGGARQREMALRGGINLVMYTLTGNYKADQVHVRDLLERLAH